MKKNKKTTDSILKDIFDSIHQTEEASAHPLADLSAPVSPNDAEAFKNSILSSAPVNRVEPFIEEKEEETVAPTEEIPVPVAVTESSVIPSVVSSPPMADPPFGGKDGTKSRDQNDTSSSTKVLNIAAVIAGIFAFVAALLILGVIWRGQEAKPGLAPTTIRSAKPHPAIPTVSAQATMAPHPILVKIDQLGHEGIRFKNYSVKNSKLMLRGFVANQSFLVKFVNVMNASPYFRNTWISSVQESKTKTYQKFYEFQIYADIRS